MKQNFAAILITLLVAVISLSSCATETPQASTAITQPSAEPSATTSSKPAKGINVLSIGQSSTIGGLKITVKEIKTTVDYLWIQGTYFSKFQPENINNGYLWVYVIVENSGNEPKPQSIYYFDLLSGNTKHDYANFVSYLSYADGNSLHPPSSYSPGNKSEMWIVFEIPKDTREVRFSVAVSGSNEQPLIWSIDDSKLSFKERNFKNLNMGQSITYGSNTVYYELNVMQAKIQNSYEEISLGGRGSTTRQKNAPSGKDWLWVYIKVQNKGSGDVLSPGSTKLIVNGIEYKYIDYFGEKIYGGDYLRPGNSKEGWRIFEVPSGTKEGMLVIELGDIIVGSKIVGKQQASWKIIT